jgi:hypothetical protein
VLQGAVIEPPLFLARQALRVDEASRHPESTGNPQDFEVRR